MREAVIGGEPFHVEKMFSRLLQFGVAYGDLMRITREEPRLAHPAENLSAAATISFSPSTHLRPAPRFPPRTSSASPPFISTTRKSACRSQTSR